MSDHADVIREAISLVGYPEGGFQEEMDAGYAALDALVAERDAATARLSRAEAIARALQAELDRQRARTW